VDTARFGDLLALVNAGLNASSAVALGVGFVLIRRRKVRAHRRAMLVAITASALFLVFYVTRVGLTGTHDFAGDGATRTVYLGVLFSHMLLAVVVVPLVLRLLYLVRAGRFREHATRSLVAARVGVRVGDGTRRVPDAVPHLRVLLNHRWR